MQQSEPDINCSICQKRIAIETAKTDEVGQAVHEECYLLKLGIGRDQDSVFKLPRMQTVDITPSSDVGQKRREA